MKKIGILGSTGSIGTQTLDIVRNNGDLKVVSLTANKNITLLEQQTREFSPEIVCVYDPESFEEFKKRVLDLDVKVVFGMEGLIQAASQNDAEIIVGAIVGMIGIRPVMEAIKAKKDIALANKETLVCAGHIIMPLVQKMGVKLYPVDSEHSAIFQCLQGEQENKIEKILLTASGGPFRGWSKEALSKVQVEDALKHPNWSMGQKITIDSSTMVNKALEVMEAAWLFSVKPSDIQIVIQPKSIIHSMVQFEDGAVKAQLGSPDMHLPIQYALYYPEHRYLPYEKLDFTKLTEIQLSVPDYEVFEGLKLGLVSAEKGGNAPTVFNAANEYAVARFLHKEIRYLDIIESIRYALEKVPFIENPTLEEVLETEKKTYEVLNCLQF